MSEFLPFHRPDLGDDEVRAVTEVIRSGWLTTGPKVRALEETFAASVMARHAVALNSCTAALHLALDAIGIAEGDEVIVPTMTFAATAEVVQYFNAVPVLVDCEPDTLNINVSSMEQAITDRTKAVIPVHYGGHPCRMSEICELARQRNVAVIEDAAHAFPASYRGTPVGTIGDVTCFSFYVTKTMTTGEGGIVTTNNLEWAERIRTMSLHGLSRDAWKRYEETGSWFYDIVAPGYKYNMPDLAAAIGLVQLQKSEQMRKRREHVAERYRAAFSDVSAITVPVCSGDVQHAWHLYAIQLDVEQLTITRNECIRHMATQGIGCSVHFIPLHLHSYYRDVLGHRPELFPCATRAFERIVSLPIYPSMTEEDVDRVVHTVRSMVENHRR